jgi:hypothetical protein
VDIVFMTLYLIKLFLLHDVRFSEICFNYQIHHKINFNRSIQIEQ